MASTSQACAAPSSPVLCADPSSLSTVITPRSMSHSGSSASPSAPPKSASGSVQRNPSPPQQTSAGQAAGCPTNDSRCVPPHSTAPHAVSEVDTRRTPTNGFRSVNASLSDLSFCEGGEGLRRSSEHSTAQHAVVKASASFPSVASPMRHSGLWHGVEGVSLCAASDTTQPSTSLSPGPARTLSRGYSTPPSPPALPSASPALTSLRSFRNDTSRTTTAATIDESLTSVSAPATSATPFRKAAATLTKKEHRRAYRLDSARARRTVVAKQRHRKLFELHSAEDVDRRSDGQGEKRQDNVEKKRLYFSRSDVGWGLAAGVSSPASTRVHHDRLEGELPSILSGPTMQSLSSAPISSSVEAAQASSSGGAPRCSSNATATTQGPRSLSPNSITHMRKVGTSVAGSTVTSVGSLTSLQHRLWQHTTANGVTAMPAASSSGGERRNGAARSLPFALRSSPSSTRQRPPPLPGLQRITPTAVALVSTGALTYPPPTALSPAEIPVTQWEESLMNERARGRQGKQVAQWLVQQLLVASPSLDLDRSRYASVNANNNGPGNRLDSLCNHPDECSGGGGLLRTLAEQAAVAAYVLSTLVEDGLPRHQQSVLPYVRILIEFAFVPDTPAIRTALGTGTVQDEELLSRLALYGHCPIPLATTRATPPSLKAGEVGTPLGGPEGAAEEAMMVDLIDLLAPAFTRKAYVTAHFELSGMTVGLAHEVRCHELHQRNVPRLLERTHKNWMRGLMRAVLRAWRHLCQERRVQEQRQRARWALRWTGERMRISLRRWRGYAAFTLQMAEADSLASATLLQKRAFVERLEKEAAAMQRSSAELQEALQRQDEERETVEAKIAERETLYQRLLRQVHEVDRVGSLMLSSLLLEKAPTKFNDASMLASLMSSPTPRNALRHGSLVSVNSAASPRRSPASSGAASSFESEEDDDEGGLQPPHAVTALLTLLQWAKDCCKVAEEEYLAFYAGDVEHGDKNEEKLEEKEDGAENASTVTSSSSPHSPQAATSPRVAAKRQQSAEKDAAAQAYHPPLDFCALFSNSTTAETGLSNFAARETVLLPMHKLLLLIRGCSGIEEGKKDMDAEQGDENTGESLQSTNAALDLMASLEKKKMAGNGVAAVMAPSLGIIRTVERADAAVLQEVYALLDKQEAALTGHYANGAPHSERADNEADALSSGVSLMLHLSDEKRNTLQRVCRIVMDAYEQLTGTACVVTAEQLFERSRGTLLVFLAALMRHYTNWMVLRTQQALPATTASNPTNAESTTAAVGTSSKTSRNTDSMGIAHERFDEWSHPPHSHRRWRRQVRRQAEWIALSFSALHDALCVAALPARVLTVRQQDHIAGLLEQLSLTELMDLLPSSPDQTMQCYVSMIGVVERHAPSLHLLFHHFALPLSQLRADGGAGVAAMVKEKPTEGSKSEEAQNSSPEKEVYITANTVWRMLCLAGLAGDGKEEYCAVASRQRAKNGKQSGGSSAAPPVTPPLAATLHRPAVFSLVEQVTQNGLAPTATSLRRSSMRKNSFTGGALADARTETPIAAMTLPQRVHTISCKTRPRAYYARALRENRHMDLRPDTGAVCVNYTQFVKILIRLAHAWQCQQQHREETEHLAAQQRKEEEEEKLRKASLELLSPEGEKPKNAAAAAGLNDSKELASTERSATTPVAAGVSTLAQQSGDSGIAAPTLTPTGTCPGSAVEASKSRPPSFSSVSSAPSAQSSMTLPSRVEYEAGSYAHPLSLPYFNTFLGELLLPRLLGANRWIGAVQRAMCSRPVLQVLAQNHDALVDIFNDYQEAREARGVRASLPPPYSAMLASQLFSRVVDSERQASTGLTTGGGRNMSHVQRATLMYGLHRRSNNAVLLDEDTDPTAKEVGRGVRCTAPQHRRPSVARSAHNSSVVITYGTQEEAEALDNLRASITAVQLRDVSIVSVLPWKEVLALAKDMRWFSIRRLTEESLRVCFEHVQVDVTREGDVIFFAEFLQLLCAVSAYASTSPAVPLEVKLKEFLESYVLSTQT